MKIIYGNKFDKHDLYREPYPHECDRKCIRSIYFNPKLKESQNSRPSFFFNCTGRSNEKDLTNHEKNI